MRRRFAWAFVRYAYLFPLLQIGVWLPLQWARQDLDRDTAVYYRAAWNQWNDTTMYEPIPEKRPHDLRRTSYLYPPPLGAALGLLPPMRFAAFAAGWAVVMLVGFWAFALALARLWTGTTALRPTLVAGAILGLTPTINHGIGFGQVDVLVWACVALTFAYPGQRGGWLALATILKVYTVWPLLALLARNRRCAAPAAAIAAAALLVCLLSLGLQGTLRESITWLRDIAPSLAQGQMAPGRTTAYLHLGGWEIALPALLPGNMSLSYAPILIAHASPWWEWDGGPLAGWVRAYLLLASVGGPLMTLWLTRRRPLHVQLASGIIAAAVLAPIFRPLYAPALVAPILVLWQARPGSPRGRVAHGSEPPAALATREA